MSVSNVLTSSILILSIIVVGFMGLQYYYVNTISYSVESEVNYVLTLFKSIVNAVSMGGSRSFHVKLSLGRLNLLDNGFIIVSFNNQCFFTSINYFLSYTCNDQLYGSKETIILHELLEDFSFSIVGFKNNIFLKFKPIVKISSGQVSISLVVFSEPKIEMIVEGELTLTVEVDYLKFSFSSMVDGNFPLKINYGSMVDSYDIPVSVDSPIIIVLKILKVRLGV